MLRISDKVFWSCQIKMGPFLSQGIYSDAFRKVFDILEDSGWSLGREDEEKEDVGLDDLPNLPYMQQI